MMNDILTFVLAILFLPVILISDAWEMEPWHPSNTFHLRVRGILMAAAGLGIGFLYPKLIFHYLESHILLNGFPIEWPIYWALFSALTVLVIKENPFFGWTWVNVMVENWVGYIENHWRLTLGVVTMFWLGHWNRVLIKTFIFWVGEVATAIFWWSVDMGAAAYRNSFLMSLVALVGWLIVWYYSRLLNKYHQRTKLVNEKLESVEKGFRASHERVRSLLVAFEALRRDIDEQRGRKSSPIAQEIRESLEDILESHGGIPKDLLFESSVQVIQLEIKACRQVRERRRRVRGNIRTQRRIDEHNRSRRT